MERIINFSSLLIFVLSFLGISNAFAANRTINLTVGYKTVDFTGKCEKAIAVNNQIPAPILHFQEGDHVTINVCNHLDKGTSIHWHGVLIPWQMDGVEGVSQKAIPPGGVFHYQFTLYQSGTYWYHAHAGLQEQQGLYGAFLVDPPQPPHYKYTKDYVVVLSDWSNTNPDQIFANLKKSGAYYSPRFRLQASLMRFMCDYRRAKTPQERQQVVDDYKMMQQMRMSIYDISDIAYDAFLLNGCPPCHPWIARVKVGDVVRLRFIGASGSTNFRVKVAGTTMQMVHVQGNDVEPYRVDNFYITPGETYDVLVKIQKNAPYIIYAESNDTLGRAVGVLMTQPCQIVNYNQVIPFPEPLPVTREMMANMMSGMMEHGTHSMAMNKTMQMDSHSMTMNKTMHMGSHSSHAEMMHHSAPSKMSNHAKMNDDMKMDHSMSMNHSMTMPTEPTIIGDTICCPNSCRMTTTGTKYQNLTAAVKTNDPHKPVNGVIKMELFGYMERFIWFINGLPEYKAKPICIESGKRYQIIFTNNSMMHHPMHIHGHWFILRNGHGAYDPLLHTIDVPPGATVVADIDADASGQWFFHCHHLYHMMAGLSRVFQYSTIMGIEKGTIQPEDDVLQQPYLNRPIVREDITMPIDHSLIHHPMAHPEGFYFASYLEVGEDPFHNAQRATFKGLYGSDYHKLELFMNDAEIREGIVEAADLDIFYWHLISQFWAIKGGVNYYYRPSEMPYWQPGISIEGVMPWFIDTDVRTYWHDGSIKLDVELSRDTQITNNFFIRAGVRSILATKTVTQAEIGSGLNQMRYIVRPYYRLMPGLNLFTEFEHEQEYGALKNIRHHIGESTSENTLTFGLSLLF